MELVDEGHSYFDLRRWKDAPSVYSSTVYGITIEKLAPGYDQNEYPTGYRHIRKELSGDRQCIWKDFMYYLPFPDAEMYKMKNFEPNPLWK